jgi:Crp-like helix-turn-helix domain
MDRLIGSYPSIARALWRETLIDASIFRERINVGVRPASARMAHLMAELRERTSAVGLSNGGGFEFPITQAELSEALGLSTVHVNRVLQAFRAERVLDLQRNITLADIEKVVETSGFDNSYLHFARNDLTAPPWYPPPGHRRLSGSDRRKAESHAAGLQTEAGVRHMIAAAEAEAEEILNEHDYVVRALALALRDNRTLTGGQIDMAIAKAIADREALLRSPASEVLARMLAGQRAAEGRRL